ncbi:hypothetical protein CALCODRAFT_368203 [Calocera cornea HHB12733]|uniref:Uncharacterized protein n=1 Tax=Calocera cornea HHB12733 TaxID=1353952 RepID=A0A165EJA1_9BASI|nr:hypothetical protein CALCODRAFT_368203 [Calocera cornea HHB12733]
MALHPGPDRLKGMGTRRGRVGQGSKGVTLAEVNGSGLILRPVPFSPSFGGCMHVGHTSFPCSGWSVYPPSNFPPARTARPSVRPDLPVLWRLDELRRALVSASVSA